MRFQACDVSRLVVDDHESTWNAGPNTYDPAAAMAIDHVGQIDRVVSLVRQSLNVSALFVTGLSNGCAMAQRYAAEAAHHVSAVTCVSHPLAIDLSAVGRRRVPMWLRVGKLDRIWGSRAGGSRTMESWKKFRGCQSETASLEVVNRAIPPADWVDWDDDRGRGDGGGGLPAPTDEESPTTEETRSWECGGAPLVYTRVPFKGHVDAGDVRAEWEFMKRFVHS